MAEAYVSRIPASEERLESRWSFLNEQSGACCVVTRKMEVLYLNQTARSLVPPAWMGRRCWEVFPVGSSSCAARCPAIKAISLNDGIVYCEETIYPGGSPVPLGVAVIPLGTPGKNFEQAVLLIRPKSDQAPPGSFQAQLLADAERLRSLCLYCAFDDDPPAA